MFGLDLGNLIVHLRADNSQYERMMRKSAALMQRTSQKMAAMGQKMSLMLTAPLTMIGGAAVKAFSSFDDAMVQSLAIMGDVSKEMRLEMEKTALSISKNSITSAKDLASSYFYLASAGMTAEQSVAALASVEKFAVAGRFDMAQATDLLTDAQTALGLSYKDPLKNQKEMIHLSDVLVKANTLANASVEQFSKALTTKSAAALRLLNKDVEEGVAVLAAFADQGVKGELAGEKLHVVLRDLQKAALRQPKVWDKLGLSVFDSSGKMHALSNIIGQLETKFGTMSDQQKKSTAQMLGFQDRSFSALQVLFGTSKKIEGYEKALRSAGGITQEVADKQLKSFSSEMKILWNNIKAVGIEIGEMLAPGIRRTATVVQKALLAWQGLNQETKAYVVTSAKLLAVMGPGLLVFSKLLAMLGKLTLAFKVLGGVFLKAFSAIKVVGLAALVPFIKIVAIIAAVSAAVLGLAYLIVGPEGLKSAWNTSRDAMSNFFQKAKGFIANFRQNMGMLLKWVQSNWRQTITNVTSMFQWLGQNWWSILKDMGRLWWAMQKSLAKNYWVMLKTLAKMGVVFIGWVVGWVAHMLEVWNQWAIGVAATFWNAIKQLPRMLLSGLGTMVKLLGAFADWVWSLWKKLWTVDFYLNMVEGLKKAGGKLIKWVLDLRKLKLVDVLLGTAEIGEKILGKMGVASAKAFEKGLKSEDLFKSLGDVLKDGAKEMEFLKGFKFNTKGAPDLTKGLTALPEFNYGQQFKESEFNATKLVPDAKKAGMELGDGIALGVVAGYEKATKKVKETVSKLQAAPQMALAGAGGGGGGTFKEMSLKRFSLAGPSGGTTRREKPKEIKAPGVEEKLDQLIKVEKKKQVAVLG